MKFRDELRQKVETYEQKNEDRIAEEVGKYFEQARDAMLESAANGHTEYYMPAKVHRRTGLSSADFTRGVKAWAEANGLGCFITNPTASTTDIILSWK